MSREAGRACVITIKKRREMVGKSWMSPVRLVVELRLRHDDYVCGRKHKRIIAELRLRDRSVKRRRAGTIVNAVPFLIEQIGLPDQYFGPTRSRTRPRGPAARRRVPRREVTG
jgi:hypothetical protein